jgi:hypothetical protein
MKLHDLRGILLGALFTLASYGGFRLAFLTLGKPFHFTPFTTALMIVLGAGGYLFCEFLLARIGTDKPLQPYAPAKFPAKLNRT